jgi:hypothetical protein
MWIKRGRLQDAWITINVPLVYMAQDVMILILMRAISITRALLRGCSWIQDLFGPWWQQVKTVPFGPKKVEISGPNPSNGLLNRFSCIKIIKSKRHTKNRNIGNFMYMSFRAHPFGKIKFYLPAFEISCSYRTTSVFWANMSFDPAVYLFKWLLPAFVAPRGRGRGAL